MQDKWPAINQVDDLNQKQTEDDQHANSLALAVFRENQIRRK
jgi:hypothetical protein